MPDQPNILWLMTDEQRGDSLGAGGAPWACTPHLDQLAHGGTRFAAAYTPSPVCVPARACMLTARAASSLGVLNNHHLLALDDPGFLTEAFAAAGYQTASFGKKHYQCPTRAAFDTEGGRTLGKTVQYAQYNVPVDFDAAGVVRYEGDVVWNWLFAGRYPGTIDDTPEMHNVRDAVAWARQRDASRPYVLRVSLNAPHTPVVTPAPFDTLVDPDAIDLAMDFADDLEGLPSPVREHLVEQAGSHRLTPAQIRRTRQCYYGYVAATDHAFGALLDGLRGLGALENTIVAFVSDHGAHLGDHGFYQKQSFYEESARVPFFFCGPGVAEGRVVETPVNVGSILPTLLALAGLPAPDGAHYPSLAPAARGEREPAREPVFSEIDYGVWSYRDGDRCVMVLDRDWKLALFRDPRDAARFPPEDGLMLHHLAEDPGERRNLAGDPACAPVVTDLLAKIDAWDRSRDIRQPVYRPTGPLPKPGKGSR